MEKKGLIVEPDLELPDLTDLSPHQADSDEDKYLVPEHIRDCWNERIRGDEPEISSGFYELTHEDDEELPICGKNKIMLIKGVEGSRKSLLLSCIMSSAFTTQQRYTLGFKLHMYPDECIVHFDTEMDKQDIKERKAQFNALCGLTPDDDRHMVFSIQDYTWRQRAEIITHILSNIDRPIAVVVIDQIADLLPNYDVNDTESAGRIIEWLLSWKRLTGAMIVVSMHTNRGGVQTNGILGKNLDHKIFASFLVEYDHNDHLSTVRHFKSRKRKIRTLKFMQDLDGKPRLLKWDDDI